MRAEGIWQHKVNQMLSGFEWLRVIFERACSRCGSYDDLLRLGGCALSYIVVVQPSCQESVAWSFLCSYALLRELGTEFPKSLPSVGPDKTS